MAWASLVEAYGVGAPAAPSLFPGGGARAYFVSVPLKQRARRPARQIRADLLIPPTVARAQTDACEAADQQIRDAAAACAVTETSELGVKRLMR